MEWFALLIPAISIAIAQYFYPHRIKYWEMLIPIVAVLIMIPIIELISKDIRTVDIEYHGGWVTEVRYYEDWNEYIHQTCTRQVPNGTDSNGNTTYTTETYDCSYVEYHPEYWEALGSNGEEIYISKEWYENLKRSFKNSTFVDMHRHYHTNDGDMHKSVWPKDDKTLQPLITQHNYINKVQASDAVFKFPQVSKEEKKLLHDYPKYNGPFSDIAILGTCNGSTEANKLLSFYNAKLGALKQIRYWILIFRNQPRDVGLKQEAYWVGGNKNEFVICINIDNNDKPTWCHAFCWSPDGYAGNDTMKINVRNNVELQSKLDFKKTIEFTVDQTNKYWRRKSFKEFDYLKIELTTGETIFIYILAMLITAGTTYFVIVNDINESQGHWHLRRGTFPKIRM